MAVSSVHRCQRLLSLFLLLLGILIVTMDVVLLESSELRHATHQQGNQIEVGADLFTFEGSN
jgi:hypothetical protein